MTGREFFRTQSIPWTPWQYVYRREFLLDNDLWQVEGHLFEDADYVLKATLAAKLMKYSPDVILRYTIAPTQTTRIRRGDDRKIEDMFYLNARVRQIAMAEMNGDEAVGRMIVGQHLYRQRACIMRYLWRARFSTILRILRRYPAVLPNHDRMLTLSSRHPLLFAVMLQCLKPVLPIARRAYLSRHKA